jgi:hypothetical protein
VATDEQVEAFHRRNVSVGSKMVGGVIGAIATLATQVPVAGPLISPIIAHGLERIGNEMIQRRLAPRQDVRVGEAINVAVMRSKEFIQQGREPRNDGFFDEDITGRSDFDEINEAAVQAAMNAAQEKKVKYIGHLMANIAFNTEISVEMAHQLIDIANSLGYRSFVLLKIIANDDVRKFQDRPIENQADRVPVFSSVMAECYGLFTRGLMEQKETPESADSHAILGADNIIPSKMCLSPLGKILSDNLDVEKINDNDVVYVNTIKSLSDISTYAHGDVIISEGNAG